MKHLKIIIATLPICLVMACNKQAETKTAEEKNEREIKISELPRAVKTGIESKFSGAILQEADEITKKDGSLTYDIEIKHNNHEMEVMFDAHGNYLGTEVDDEDIEGEDED